MFEEGLALFNEGNFFHAHEVWEDLWRNTTHPEKQIIQGMIQIAVAMYHHSTGNREGAESVMERALRNLEGADVWFRGINMAQLREDVARAAGELKSNREVTLFQIARI